MKLARVILSTIKGVYDILASYLLAFILPFALAAFGLHLVATLLAHSWEFQTSLEMWEAASNKVGIGDEYLRLIAVLPAHILLYLGLRRPKEFVQPYFEAGVDKAIAAFHKVTTYLPSARTFGELFFSLTVTALLIPFVLQPTLVHGMGTNSWVQRGANLLDGTASAELVSSTVGLYRKLYATPVYVEGVDSDEVDKAIAQVEQSEATAPPIPTGKQPMMDRWNPYIAAVAGEDADQFAYIKAFMWVESAGRQYAVSHTGCAGLMQFCSGTARSQPYKDVFGVGQVYNCGCRTKDCRVPREVQRDLESGDPEAINRQKSNFPCELTDARFDPKKAIAAGGLYVDRLRKAYGGNIYLMYIGYNSGPAVASKVWRAVGRNPNASLEEINQHLAIAMLPHYGDGSARRARSLVRTHLPKIKKAFDKYRAAGLPSDIVETPADVPEVDPSEVPMVPAPAVPAGKQ